MDCDNGIAVVDTLYSTTINDAGKLVNEQRVRYADDSSIPVTKVYFKRWLMLAIFIIYAIAGIGQWLQYSIISNIISR